MKQFGKKTAAILFLLVFSLTAAMAEENAEQGVEEIKPLMEMSDVPESEGMSLEEMTDAFSETAMSEYFDSISGFRMQYPSIFQFNEEAEGNMAVSEDGKATLSIIHQPGGLTEEMLIEAIKLEFPDAEPKKNELNGCLRTDSVEDNGKTCRTKLYLLTDKSFHIISISYPADEQETYDRYIEYMVNTMETSDTDLG